MIFGLETFECDLFWLLCSSIAHHAYSVGSLSTLLVGRIGRYPI